MKIKVPVVFQGVVEVEVLDSLTSAESRCLAEKLALSRVVADILINEDGPEEDAFEDFKEETGLGEQSAEVAWDNANVIALGGTWNIRKSHDL